MKEKALRECPGLGAEAGDAEGGAGGEGRVPASLGGSVSGRRDRAPVSVRQSSEGEGARWKVTGGLEN